MKPRVERQIIQDYLRAANQPATFTRLRRDGRYGP